MSVLSVFTTLYCVNWNWYYKYEITSRQYSVIIHQKTSYLQFRGLLPLWPVDEGSCKLVGIASIAGAAAGDIRRTGAVLLRPGGRGSRGRRSPPRSHDPAQLRRSAVAAARTCRCRRRLGEVRRGMRPAGWRGSLWCVVAAAARTPDVLRHTCRYQYHRSGRLSQLWWRHASLSSLLTT